MPIEKQVVPLSNGLKVYVEHRVFNPAFETVNQNPQIPDN